MTDSPVNDDPQAKIDARYAKIADLKVLLASPALAHPVMDSDERRNVRVLLDEAEFLLGKIDPSRSTTPLQMLLMKVSALAWCAEDVIEGRLPRDDEEDARYAAEAEKAALARLAAADARGDTGIVGSTLINTRKVGDER